MSTITIQPGQEGEGMVYNVRKPLPYPYHLDPETGDCMEPFEGERLIGFSNVPFADPTNLLIREDWASGDVQRAVGMFPVFVSKGGGIYTLTLQTTGVTFRDDDGNVVSDTRDPMDDEGGE